MAKTGHVTNRLRKVLRLCVVNVLVFGVLLAILEGMASLAFITHEIVRTPSVPEHTHAEHDDTLGWVNLPNVYLPDFYGRGVEVRTNAQRFRSDHDFSREVPPGKLRLVCSGDSFTFGFGVGNQQTWCERLATLDPHVETVNMGLGGYGVDQAYLRYIRDGIPLEHDLHIFSFLSDDFERMRSDRFMGYGRPYLAVHDDSLVVSNFPVPRTSWLTRRIALHRHTLGKLNLVKLLRKLFNLDDPKTLPDSLDDGTVRLREIASRIFGDLARVSTTNRSQLVLVFLPGTWDYKNQALTTTWRRFVRAEAERQNIHFIDLVEEIRHVPPTEVDSLFAPNAHFSVAGNAWAASVLHVRLAPIIELSRTTAAPDGS